MVLDETPKQESAPPHTLTTPVDTAVSRRLSIISNAVSSQRLLNPKKSYRRLQFRPSHPALAQHNAATDVDNEANAAQMPIKKSSQQSAAQPKKSRSSIFDLFSKPKVEKSRVYGGEAAITPSLPPQPKTAPPSRPPPREKPITALPPHNAPIRPTSPQQTYRANVPFRASVALHSAKTPPARSLTQRISMQRLKPTDDYTSRPEITDKSPGWVAPPLFQAFARSVRNGVAETSPNSADKHAARLRAAAKEKELEELVANNNRDSLGSEVSGATRRRESILPPSRTLAGANVDVPQKIVVLLDDGHLLQYSQLGPTNRLPEKVLQLGPESAVFLGEVSAQSPGALRVVQNTGSRSFSLQSTVNALSRLTRRTVSSKRDVPNLLFYFSSAEETKDWVEAIRKFTDAAARPGSTSSKDTSDKWQVDSVVGDSTMTTEIQPSVAKSTSTTNSISTIESSQAKALPNIPSAADQTPTQTARHAFDEDSDEDRKGSLEILEEEVDKLVVSPSTRLSVISGGKRVSDASSYTSSSTPSMDAQALANLRNSVRMSHTSNVTGITSRTNSITSEPSSNKVSLESSADNGSIKSPYRNLQSYQAAKRRSVLPMVNTTVPPQPIIELTSPGVPTPTPTPAPNESPLLSAVSPIPTPTSTTSTASRSSISRSPSTANSTHESKTPEPLPQESTPTIAEEDERPESIVADLPPPSTWSTKLSPKKRASICAPPPADRHQFRLSSAPLVQTPQQAAASATRRASHGFRIPLKINPNLPTTRPPLAPKNKDSSTLAAVPEKPKVFTLEAKVDPNTHSVTVGTNTYSSHDNKQRATQRLSLFPSPLLSQPPFSEQPRARPASVARTSQVAPEAVPSRHASLQRPASLQVRSSHAPFLASARSPTSANAPVTNAPTTDRRVVSSTAVPIRAAPIRQLKPSRSASVLQSTTKEYARPASPTDPFTSGRLAMHRESDSYQPARQTNPNRASYSVGFGPPLAPPPVAPMQIAGNSFAQQKAMNRTSLRPRQSIIAPLSGINMVELGPPAPPPNAPLPAPPDGAPPGILSLGTMSVSPPLKNHARLSVQAPHINGLGIRT